MPIRLGSPLLWDEAGQRLVAIGADAFGAGDSIEDAWEFRVATGWRRIRLPRLPAGGAFSSQGLVADPHACRFLVLRKDAASNGGVRLWSMDIAPLPGWELMDSQAGAPDGDLMLDPGGESAWLRTRLRQDGTSDLWTRSLADTGLWRRVRMLPPSGPPSPRWRVDQWIEPRSGRLFEMNSFEGGPPIPHTWIQEIPVDGAEAWRFVKDVSAFTFRAVPDTARGRQLLLDSSGPYVEGLTLNSVWEFSPSDSQPVRLLATVEGHLGQAAFGLSRDTLWVHGTGGVSYSAGARTLAIPLADPAASGAVSNPAWPRLLGNDGESAFIRDRAGSRWLYLPALPAFAGTAMPDTSWELTLQGDAVRWRTLAIAGPIPGRANHRAWANDPEGRTLYLMNGWEDGSGVQNLVPELWAFHYGDVPGWELARSGGEWPVLRGTPVLTFDPASRELVCFGYLPYGRSQPDTNLVWTLAVDDASAWRARPADGTPPYVPDPASAVFDPLHDRIVFRSLDPPLGALELRPRLRWVSSSLPSCSFGVRDGCVPALSRTRAIHDPFGSRLLLLGGFESSLMRYHDELSTIELGDSLGPARLVDVLGSPGDQDVAMCGYDEARDALLVFGNRSYAGSSLYEFPLDRGNRTLARLDRALALEDRVAVSWRSAPGSAFLLWRHAPGGGWQPVRELTASAGGLASHEDREIEAGENYGYMLTSTAPPYDAATAPAWVTAGGSPSYFALAAPWPNPAHGPLNVAFTTAAASPAELDLFDVAGRRVWSRRWDAPAAGPHFVAVGARDLPRSGLYFLRLRQAGLTSTRRVVLAP